ncbi:MAG: hypothetical protein ACLP5H_13215, partial [Desulfomonilaceae bacterium]
YIASSSISATLDTGGWLGLTRRGLAPRKRRQASPGAPQIHLYLHFVDGFHTALLDKALK